MSRGLGRLERVILWYTEQAQAAKGDRRPSPLLLDSQRLTHRCFKADPGTPAQRKAVSRAMHSFVRKFPQYALTGGRGRSPLSLFEPGDPLSAERAKLSRLSKSQ
jgi:hypothetical protein